jgi:hypothetical protein
MLPSWANQSITVVRPGTKESRGSVIPDWSPDKITKKTINGCSVQPASTSLSQDGRVLGVTEGMTAYLPEGSDVKAGDRIEYNGETFTINGEPRVWVAPFTRSNIQLNLVRWEG